MTQQTNGMPELKYSKEAFRDMYEELKANREWLEKFTMKFYITAENPTYENMKKLYTELFEFVQGMSKALAKADGKQP